MEEKTMTELEMKENLKKKCKQAWDLYNDFKSVKGDDDIMTQKFLTKWVTYEDLYKEFLGKKHNTKFFAVLSEIRVGRKFHESFRFKGIVYRACKNGGYAIICKSRRWGWKHSHLRI